jgi:DNA sulfur modification protein DndE|tara:strand:+ start:408 stop:740 length:333 start_codon:yes stop_codon:yes gene_type:complete
MLTRIKISNSATSLLGIRFKTAQQHYTPNIILRNALMFSISNGDKYDEHAINMSGTEFQISTLFGNNSNIYKLLIDQYYKRKLSDQDYKTILVYHFEKGLSHEDFKSVFN